MENTDDLREDEQIDLNSANEQSEPNNLAEITVSEEEDDDTRKIVEVGLKHILRVARARKILKNFSSSDLLHVYNRLESTTDFFQTITTSNFSLYCPCWRSTHRKTTFTCISAVQTEHDAHAAL